MGISQIMQPRVPVAAENRPPSDLPAVPPVDVSQDQLPARHATGSPSISEVSPSRSLATTTGNIRKPRKPKPKPVTDKKLRKVVGLILALKVNGKSRKEIADELELTENTVKTYLYRARKKGYLDATSFDDPTDIVETVIRPRVVENVEKLLNWTNPKTGLPSMEMTIETAKGIGVFQQHSVNKGNQGPVQNNNVLRVQILMPPTVDSNTVVARTGAMGGRQAVEGEVLEVSEGD